MSGCAQSQSAPTPCGAPELEHPYQEPLWAGNVAGRFPGQRGVSQGTWALRFILKILGRPEILVCRFFAPRSVINFFFATDGIPPPFGSLAQNFCQNMICSSEYCSHALPLLMCAFLLGKNIGIVSPRGSGWFISAIPFPLSSSPTCRPILPPFSLSYEGRQMCRTTPTESGFWCISGAFF